MMFSETNFENSKKRCAHMLQILGEKFLRCDLNKNHFKGTKYLKLK